MMMQRGFVPIIILVSLLIIAGIAGGAYYLGKQASPKPSPAPVVTSPASRGEQTPQSTSSPTPGETVYTEAARSANWKTFKDEKFNFQVNHPLDAEIIRPNFNTIGDTPSDVIIKFNYDKKCLENLNKDGKIECLGDTVDVFVISNASKTAQQIAEEDKKNLHDERCIVNTTNLGTPNIIASELTGCLISGSSFYYLGGTDRHIFKIGISENNDATTKQILSSFKFL